jgi:hypothetical protein
MATVALLAALGSVALQVLQALGPHPPAVP